VSASARAFRLAELAARAAETKKASDIVAFDVSEPLALTDIFLLASGDTERNVQAIADQVVDALSDAGARLLRQEGRSVGRWVLLDFGDLVVHVFHLEDRLFYALERLWKDCPPVFFPPISTARISGASGQIKM